MKNSFSSLIVFFTLIFSLNSISATHVFLTSPEGQEESGASTTCLVNYSVGEAAQPGHFSQVAPDFGATKDHHNLQSRSPVSTRKSDQIALEKETKKSDAEGTTLNIPHIATDWGWKTKLIVDNSDAETRSISVTLYKDGALLSDDHSKIGYKAETEKFSQVDSTDAPSYNTSLYFPRIMESDGWHTILGISNPHDESLALELTAYNHQGEPLETITIDNIEANGSFIRRVDEIFHPDSTPSPKDFGLTDIAWVRATSNKQLHGFMEYNTDRSGLKI